MTPTAIAPTVPIARPTGLFQRIARILRRARRRHPAREADAEAARARRAFILDRLAENSDAFASDHDVQAMMSHFPRDF